MSDHNAGVISFGITASNKKGKHSMGISASQYGNIMEKYDRTRMKNQRILDERTASIHKEIPEIEKLQGEIIHLSFQQARSELLQPDSASSTAAQYMLHMKELAEKIIKANKKEYKEYCMQVTDWEIDHYLYRL